jgi:peptide/nickel transport system ATP-binding protein
MYLGNIVELATVETLYTKPRHPYTEALLSAVPRTDPDQTSKRIILQGDVPSPSNPPSGCKFHPRCPYAEAICSEEVPPLKEVAPGHVSACHFSDRLDLVGIS